MIGNNDKVGVDRGLSARCGLSYGLREPSLQ